MSTVEACKSLVREAFVSPDKWQSNLARAEESLSEALAGDPANPLLLTCLGAVLCDQGQHARAAQVLRRAVEHGSQDRNTYFNLAVAVLSCGTHEEAMRLFSRARSLQPSSQSWEAYFDPQAQ